MPKPLKNIGRMSYIKIAGYNNIPAKVDTGADISSVWASSITVDKAGVLHYVLFDSSSPFYDGAMQSTSNYKVSVVRSSNGHEQIRYTVKLSLGVEGRLVKATLTLADRNKNKFPVLIGSRLLKGRFLVDSSMDNDYKRYTRSNKASDSAGSRVYTALSQQDPLEFYKKHYLKQR